MFELCLNGMDDDDDGAVDCADDDCVAGYTCADLPPPGFLGPIALWNGAGGASPPGCQSSGGYDAFEAAGHEGLSASSASCASCACGTPVGVSCQISSVGFWGGASCSAGKGTLTIAGAGACIAFVTSSFDPMSSSWDTAPASGGACLPQTIGSTTLPPLQWQSQVVACGEPPVGGGCGADMCLPRPSAPFQQPLCIYQGGDVACPAGPYANKLLYFQGVDDDRSCTGCACQDPTGTTCGGTVKLYEDTQCTQNEVTMSSVGECTALSPDPTPPSPPYFSLRSVRYVGSSGQSGSCGAVPSAPTGTVTPNLPVTFCCQ